MLAASKLCAAARGTAVHRVIVLGGYGEFGSRIAKLSNVRDFGSNRQANAMNAGTVVLPDAM